MKSALIVDDSAVVRKVARRILETFGLEVRDAEDGEGGLSACAERMPDLILLDGAMPGMDGYGVLRTLREGTRGAHPKVLFCTTENDVGAIARALRAGADAYLMKPFDRDLLRGKLEGLGHRAPAEAA